MIPFKPGPGGLLCASISTPASEAELYLQGGHLARWTPRGQQPVLFMSPKSLFSPGKAIRGGVPIIFPWFGSREGGKPGPAHGFARTAAWTHEGSRELPDSRIEVTLGLRSDDATRKLFEGEFQLRFRVTIGRELEMELETSNLGNSPFTFEEALHTYLAVGDVRQVSVRGLENTTYIDKTDGFKRRQQVGDVRIAKETDSVYLNTRATCVVTDPVWKRQTVVEKTGSESTVIWDPWVEKTRGMSDMAPDSWENMICVETGNAADNAVTLAPGDAHRLGARIRVG
jgi:glucose-6-phosphate 1-epimerase